MKCPCKNNCGLEVPAGSNYGKVKAVYKGIQNGPDFWMTLYDVRGPHHLDGSTVSVMTLVDNGIEITDMTEEEIQKEYARLKTYLKEAA